MAGIIGSALGAGIGAAGSIIRGIQSARRVRKDLNARHEENQKWYDRRYNEDATQPRQGRAYRDISLPPPKGM